MDNARKMLYGLFENDEGYNNGLWCGIPIEVMTNEQNDKHSLPNDYILLRYDLSNTKAVIGDGFAHVRESFCDIMLISAGANSDKLLEMEIKIAKLLDKLETPYQKINLGYDKNSKQTQITFSIAVYLWRE